MTTTRQSARQQGGTTPQGTSPQHNTGIRVPRRSGAKARAPWILLAPFLALFLLTFILPILVAIASSFTKVTRRGLFGEAGVTSEFAWFSNYAQALATATSSPPLAGCSCLAWSRCRS